MTGNSRPVVSSQTTVHPRLLEAVKKHSQSHYQKPIADHSLRSFEKLWPLIDGQRDRLRLDTGCGIGESTVSLAQLFPEDFIIGIDKSAHRIDTHQRALFDKSPKNYTLVRGDLEDFWRLFQQNSIHFKVQYFFYPNPWPRPEHYLRRWPAHPLFPLITQLSQELEVRSNWDIYVDEFLEAWKQVTGLFETRELWNPAVAQTPFERKYQSSGQALWRGLCRWIKPDPA